MSENNPNHSINSDYFADAWRSFINSGGVEIAKALLDQPIPGLGASVNDVIDKLDFLAPVREATLKVFQDNTSKILNRELTAQEFGVALLNELGINDDGSSLTPNAFEYSKTSPQTVLGSDLLLGLDLKINNGTVSAGNDNWGLDLDFDVTAQYAVPISADFGTSNLLRLKSDGEISIGAEAGIKASIGFDNNGFYFSTGKNLAEQDKTKATISLVGNLNGATGLAELAVLDLQARDTTSTGNDLEVSYVGVFADKDPDKLLRLDEVVSKDFDYTDNFDIVADLDLGLSLAPLQFLPSVTTDFTLDWTLSEGKNPAIAFNNIAVDVSKLFGEGSLIYETFQKLKGIVDFSKGVTDALTTEIATLKELGQPYTLLQLAEKTGVIDPSVTNFIEWVGKFNNVVNSLAFSSEGIVGVGSISLDDTVNILDASFNSANAKVIKSQSDYKAELKSQGWVEVDKFEDFVNYSEDFSSGKFELDLIEDPLTFVGNLLLNKPSNIFSFETPGLNLAFDFEKTFPVYGPIAVRLAGSAGASALLAGGYDTYGLLETLKGYYNGEDVGWSTFKALDGFYLDSEKTQASLNAGLELSGGADAVVASVFAGGGLYGNVSLGLDDPNNDGKLRLGEGGAAVLANGFDPSALFDLSGKLSFEGFVEGRIGWSWASMRKRYVFYTQDILNYQNGSLTTFAAVEGPRLQGAAASLPEGIVKTSVDGKEVYITTQDSGTFDSPEESVTIVSSRSTGTWNLFSQDGDDTFELSGSGVSKVNGGGGLDIVSYRLAESGVFLNFVTGVHGGADAVGDVFTAIEQFEGTQHDDTMVAGSMGLVFKGLGGTDSLIGGVGDDIFEGGQGADTINGGGGRDFAIYMDSGEAVAVNLSTRTATGGDAVGDILTSIDNLVGSKQNDTLTGSNLSNYIFGYRGNDLLYGEEGDDSLEGGRGADTMFGGTGSDYVTYNHSFEAVYVNLSTASLAGGHALGDILIGVENLAGSRHNDTVIGDSIANKLHGRLGDDDLSGASGDDALYGDEGNDTLLGESGNDALYGSTGANLLIGGLGNDLLVSESAADTLQGGSGNDTYRISKSGALILEGQDGGFDVLYSPIALSVLPFGIEEIVVESAPGATPAALQTSRTIDRLLDGVSEVRLMGSANINANGNSGANAIYGNSGANALGGDLGSDFISGGEGNDTLTGCSIGSGRGKGEMDILTGGSGVDTFVLGAGGAFYNDGNRKKAGREDYALIMDFKPGEDRLQLSGKKKNYFLKSSKVDGVSGRGLYFDSNKNGSFDKRDELVAIINSSEGINLTFQNTIKTAIFA
jgi:Ca2+-binding RTX toxin-like protein